MLPVAHRKLLNDLPMFNLQFINIEDKSNSCLFIVYHSSMFLRSLTKILENNDYNLKDSNAYVISIEIII
jgi:hypothetical protein